MLSNPNQITFSQALDIYNGTKHVFKIIKVVTKLNKRFTWEYSATSWRPYVFNEGLRVAKVC